jgi:hypothetical protein
VPRRPASGTRPVDSRLARRPPRARFWRAERGATRVVGPRALALATLVALGCAKGDLPIELNDSDNVLGDSSWVQVLVFDGQCPPLGDIVLGSYDSPQYEQTAEADDAFEAIGTLPAGPVGFAIVTRTDTCQVVGVGCTNVDLRDAERIDILVGRVYDSSSRTACEAQCVQGRCATGDAKKTSTGGKGPVSL